MYIYKHTKTIDYVKKIAYFFRKIQYSGLNNLRVLRRKNAKFCTFKRSFGIF